MGVGSVVVISIHAARVGSDLTLFIFVIVLKQISIHAARVGSDKDISISEALNHFISIHAARVGSDTVPLTSFAIPA